VNLTQKIKEKFIDNVNMASGMLRSMRGDPQAWEASIRRFETRELHQPVPADVVLFTGSSSITFWSTLERDMAPIPVVNRGFGGSKIADVVHYITRIILRCLSRAIVLFAGTNDIAWPQPATAQQVLMDTGASFSVSMSSCRKYPFTTFLSARRLRAGAVGRLSVKPII
jgi:hypothetical protein